MGIGLSTTMKYTCALPVPQLLHNELNIAFESQQLATTTYNFRRWMFRFEQR